MKTKRCSGALPCPAPAGGAKPSALASPPALESESDQTRRIPQAASVAPVARGAASPAGCCFSVIGAVQYGTSKVFYKIVPHFDTEALRQYIHQVMHIFSKTAKEVVRSWIAVASIEPKTGLYPGTL